MSAIIQTEAERLFAAERALAEREALERVLEQERALTDEFFRREEQELLCDCVVAI